jgi:LAO/AO transport system kinase
MEESKSSLDDLARRLRSGDRVELARAITLVESRRSDHRRTARAFATMRVGITGAPGVGKSTLIDALGSNLTAMGHRIAVLAVDPSSKISGGSILGDKTRMARLALDPNASIRPSPAAGTLGGVAARTREAILCEAAGFDVLLIETVGIGQSETAVADMTDFSLVLTLPGAGDELSGRSDGAR